MDLAWHGAILLLLVLLNGFFSLSEMALVTARRALIELRARQGSRRAAQALTLLREPESFLSVVQIGITLIGIGSGAFGEAAFSTPLAAALAGLPGLAGWAQPLATVIVVGCVTVLTLLFGELAPKRLGIAHSERLALAVAPVMAGMLRLFLPAARLLSFATRLILRLLGVRELASRSVTEDEIRVLIREGAETGVLEAVERDMLERVIRLGDRRADSLMTHRSQVVWLDPDVPLAENLARMRERPASRYPVARETLQNVTGVIRASLAAAACLEGRGLAWDAAEPPVYVPETAPALALLERFKSTGAAMAFVIDEYGVIQGLITPRDVMEAIVGDIAETPDEEPRSARRADGSWLLDGLTPVDEILALLGVESPEALEEAEESRTLAGFMLTRLGRIPDLTDAVEWQGWRFEVVDMDGRRIDRVLAAPLQTVRKT